MQFSEETGDLFGALAKAAAKIGNVPKSRTVSVRMKSGGEYQYSYAPMDAVLDAIREPLTANGLWYLQAPTQDGTHLTTRVFHSSGQWLETLVPFHISEDRLTGPQALGAAMTFHRRYALLAALGLAPEDDDAQEASPPPQRASTAPSPPRKSQPPREGAAPATGGDVTFKFGQAKGSPLEEGSDDDLDWYRGAIAKSVDDPAKARWRDSNLAHLQAIDDVIAQRAAYNAPPPADAPKQPAFDDDDIPF